MGLRTNIIHSKQASKNRLRRKAKPPLQVLTLGEDLLGLCADEQRVWVANVDVDRVHVLKIASC